LHFASFPGFRNCAKVETEVPLVLESLGTILNVVLCCFILSAAQVVESLRNQTVPVNSVARFICRTAGLVVWRINDTQLSSDNAGRFRLRGIQVDDENGSVLLVNSSIDDNGTIIHCLTGEITDLMVIGTAFLIVFGE